MHHSKPYTFMKIFIFFMFVSFCLSTSFSAHAKQIAQYKLAVFGDSLAAGYRLPRQESFYMQLQNTLRQAHYPISVLNASKSGDTTSNGLDRQKKVLKKRPDLVILELGINDAIRGYPITTIRKNLDSLILTFQKNKIPVMLVGMKAPPFHSSEYQQQFEKMYQDLATQYDLVFYPFFMDGLFEKQIETIYPKASHVLSDNLHPNATGVQTMVQRIFPTVKQFLKRYHILPRKTDSPSRP